MNAVGNREQAKEHLTLGMQRSKLKDYEGAIAEYDVAIQLDPTNAEAHNNRGNAYAMLEARRDAVADYTEAIRLNPEFALAYYNRGLEKQLDGDIEGAIADYKTALSLPAPDTLRPQEFTARLHSNLGILYETLGDHASALASFDQAIQLDPRNAPAYYNRGKLHEWSGNYTQAVADYRSVLQLVPDHPQSRYMLGLIKMVEYLQAELRTRLSKYTTEIDQAVADVWPLLVRALEGVQLNASASDPFALLDRNTVDSLVKQKNILNTSANPRLTKGQQSGNGN